MLWPGDAIRTSPDGQAGLSFADGSEVVLQGSTTLMLDRFFLRTQAEQVIERFGRMVLFAGSLAFNVKPFPNVPSPWEFVTGSEIIGITGTSGVMAVGQKDSMADLPENVRKLIAAGDGQAALAAAKAAGLEIPAGVEAALARGDQAGAAAAAGAANQKLETKRDLPAGMQAALDSQDFAGAEAIARAANFEIPAELQAAISQGRSGKQGAQAAGDRPEVPAAVQAALDAGDFEAVQAAVSATGFTPPADLQKAIDDGRGAVAQGRQQGQDQPELPAAVKAALEAGDLNGAKQAASNAGFTLPAEIQASIEQNASAQRAAGVAAEPMPAAVKAALDAGDVAAAQNAAAAAGYTMPPDVQGAVDKGFEARKVIDAQIEDGALKVKPELPADIQAALDSGNVSLARDLAGKSGASLPPNFSEALDAADNARTKAASSSVASDTTSHELTFALVEGSAVLTEIVAAKPGTAADGNAEDAAAGIRVAEVPAGVSLVLPTLKPPDKLDAVIATIAADGQGQDAVAEVAESSDAAASDGKAADKLKGIVARDSDGDGAVDQFAVSFDQKSNQASSGTDGAAVDVEKAPANTAPGEQKLPPTAWGVLGAATVAAQQALPPANGEPTTNTDGAPLAAADGAPTTDAEGAPVAAGQLLEQVKLANMVRMVISDEGARKELVASGNMERSLQTALVNISEKDTSRSSLSLMARAGGFQVD
ncbi:MAG TPA: hypothetical protein DGO43_03625, partial [Chloroflexi bacterium]|nr:hypothetical protein [Chloroflexota bacterium]